MLWHATSKGAWISPGTTLQIPIPHQGEAGWLLIDFEVLDGTDVDFEIGFTDEEDTKERLYGPARRAKQVRAAVPLPRAGIAYATFDNFGSWVTYKRVRYSLQLAHRPPEGHTPRSSLRFAGPNGNRADASGDGAPAPMPQPEDPLDGGMPQAPVKTLRVAAGAHEDVSVDVPAGARLLVSLEVVAGRDVDFAISMETEDGVVRIFGPARRSTKLLANVAVPHAGRVHMGFDASGAWWGTKSIRYAYQVFNDETI